MGGVQLTTAAATALLEAGIETVFLSLGGKYRGRLAPVESKNVALRVAQVRRYDDLSFRLELARKVVAAKIANCGNLLAAYAKNHPEADFSDATAALSAGRSRAEGTADSATLLGVEGEAAKAYFTAYGAMFRGELQFSGRTRRPPRDPVNALLSFGYTVLLTETVGAVAAVGLDPYVGFYHALDYGRPSLALDLLEEFRHPVIDALTLSLANRKVLTPADFEPVSNDGVYLRADSRKRWLTFYERTLNTPFTQRGDAARPASFRDRVRLQARLLAKAMLGEAEYVGFERRRG